MRNSPRHRPLRRRTGGRPRHAGREGREEKEEEGCTHCNPSPVMLVAAAVSDGKANGGPACPPLSRVEEAEAAAPGLPTALPRRSSCCGAGDPPAPSGAPRPLPLPAGAPRGSRGRASCGCLGWRGGCGVCGLRSTKTRAEGTVPPLPRRLLWAQRRAGSAGQHVFLRVTRGGLVTAVPRRQGTVRRSGWAAAAHPPGLRRRRLTHSALHQAMGEQKHTASGPATERLVEALAAVGCCQRLADSCCCLAPRPRRRSSLVCPGEESCLVMLQQSQGPTRACRRRHLCCALLLEQARHHPRPRQQRPLAPPPPSRGACPQGPPERWSSAACDHYRRLRPGSWSRSTPPLSASMVRGEAHNIRRSRRCASRSHRALSTAAAWSRPLRH